MSARNFVSGILSDETYEEQKEPDYDRGERAVGGDTSYDQINAALGGSSTVAGAAILATASGVGAAAVGGAAGAAGLYKLAEGVLGMSGMYEVDDKIEADEAHFDSRESDSLP